ncbi:MAG: helix-turn-helix transcriptional regulator [Dermatophilaceae bacterium]|nr:helix-turn-helix transcriptional regulator [Dermatophilaceae bacterium]
MNAATFKAIREGLGLTARDVSERLDINPRTVDRWEAGHSPIPSFAADAIEEWEALAADTVNAWVEAMHGDQHPTVVLTTGDEDEPRRWQRAIAFRVRQQVPNVAIMSEPD